jgi:two-component system, OmpR family, phosphate regulon sensor histidine kinase PhoR
MRRSSSIGGRLRTGFALFVVLLAAAGAVVYAGFGRQEGAIRQLNDQIYVLRRVTDDLDGAFGDSQLAMANYQLTFEERFLSDYDDDGAFFDSDLALMRHYAPPGMRGLVDRQDQAGLAWFAIADRIIADPAIAVSDTTRTDEAWAANRRFNAANTAMVTSINATITRLVRQSNSALSIGLTWSAAALAIAIGLGLAIAAGTVRRTLGPLRRLTATVNRLTAGDQSARMQASGPTEIQAVARAVNALADESDRLREKEASRTRLRAMATEAGFSIREHLHAEDVIRAARAALEENLDADLVYLYLVRDGKMGAPEGHEHDWLFPPTFVDDRPLASFQMLDGLLRRQSSQVTQDMGGPEGDLLRPEVREPMRQIGVVSHLLTPFGVGAEMLGFITADRLHPGHPWTVAEVDAVESIAADLGRGLHHARLYEDENRLVEELKAVDRAKSDFVATVSHELRTPLSSVTGYIEMLLDRDLGQLSPEQEHALETVSRNAARLQDLIEDLLTLSAIEAGTFTTVTRPTSLLDILSGAGEDIQPATLSKGITLAVALPADGLVVNGDASQLHRVITNLLSNAVKFTPAGGRVTLTAGVDGEWVVVSVADTGIGIPDGDKKDLFTRFFRASNATKRAIPGTGLGLAIVQTIIAGHGGQMTLESEEGIGTTVSVRLPLAEPAPTEPVGRPVPVPGVRA